MSVPKLFGLTFSIVLVVVVEAKSTIWDPVQSKSIEIDATQQHVPHVFPHLIDKRPPRPLMPKHRPPTIFIGIAAFRDGKRCGRSLLTAFSNADDASRIYIGVVDQAMDSDPKCLDEYCKLAEEKGYFDASEQNQNDTTHPNCPHLHQIRILKKLASDSKGPTVARSWQQSLLRDEDFCLQIDAHSVFTESWDSTLMQDWLRAKNEMAVLSTYINDYGSRKTWPIDQHPHLCRAIVGSNGLVRNDGASIAGGITKPLLTCFWGAGLSFGKCHSERRVPLDPLSEWVFDGEEFVKASRLWTNGYDIYTPTTFAIYHDYTSVPHRFEQVPIDPVQKEKETRMGINRVKLTLNLSFDGPVNTDDIDQYRMGSVRSFHSYLNFSGVHLENRSRDENRCRQLYWTPYEDFEPVRQIVQDQLDGDWMFYPPYEGPMPSDYVDSAVNSMDLTKDSSSDFVMNPSLVVFGLVITAMTIKGWRRNKTRATVFGKKEMYRV